jgi:HEAT repeat protein
LSHLLRRSPSSWLCSLAVPWAIACLGAAGLAFAQDAAKLQDLERKLRDPQEKTRRECVQELARIATPEAWRLVLGALDDGSAMVADEAQLQLGKVAQPAVVAELFGKTPRSALASKDEWVRQRAAEVLGRLEPMVPAKDLAQALGDKEAPVRRAVCWSAERLGDRDRLEGSLDPLREALAKLAAKDRDEGARSAAVCAMAALPRDSAGTRGLTREETEVFFADKSPLVRSAALLATQAPGSASRPRLEAAELLALAQCGLLDSASGVRAQAVECLARHPSRESLRALVDALERESELRLRWSLVEHLRRLSGLRHRLDARPWQAWVDALPADWTPPAASSTTPASPAGEAPAPGDESTATLRGLPILSQRVAFLIDLSGSMAQRDASGKTRKERVDVELERALTALTPEVEFNLIPYTNAPIPWQPKLVPATPANVKQALEFFVARKDSGKGNFWDALELALADPGVDTVFVLTDGAPTGGHRWNLELMKSLFAERNRFRRVTLRAVLAGSSKTLERHWGEMCRASGGELLAVD